MPGPRTLQPRSRRQARRRNRRRIWERREERWEIPPSKFYSTATVTCIFSSIRWPLPPPVSSSRSPSPFSPASPPDHAPAVSTRVRRRTTPPRSPHASSRGEHPPQRGDPRLATPRGRRALGLLPHPVLEAAQEAAAGGATPGEEPCRPPPLPPHPRPSPQRLLVRWRRVVLPGHAAIPSEAPHHAKPLLEDQLLSFALVPLAAVAAVDGARLARDFELLSTDLLHSPAGTIRLSLALLSGLPGDACPPRSAPSRRSRRRWSSSGQRSPALVNFAGKIEAWRFCLQGTNLVNVFEHVCSNF
ncbi:hypothetical protein EJB05_16382 [Eragrostis curvula]|uniref:Uncharacterized protein n=1 Tax=Eragrostis curvula TaxID=38414 RepID=A0A5J9VEY0_9POAL|nr:hypothetical protein EJB05_16382 [Eragrostis curvula]